MPTVLGSHWGQTSPINRRWGRCCCCCCTMSLCLLICTALLAVWVFTLSPWRYLSGVILGTYFSTSFGITIHASPLPPSGPTWPPLPPRPPHPPLAPPRPPRCHNSSNGYEAYAVFGHPDGFGAHYTAHAECLARARADCKWFVFIPFGHMAHGGDRLRMANFSGLRTDPEASGLACPSPKAPPGLTREAYGARLRSSDVAQNPTDCSRRVFPWFWNVPREGMRHLFTRSAQSHSSFM